MGNDEKIKELEISTSRMVLKLLKLLLFSLIRLRFYIPGIPEIKVQELNELINSNQAPLIIDTRDKNDFYVLEGAFSKYGHIPNAKLIPLFQLTANLIHLAAFKDKPMVTICPGGGASLVAAEVMIKAGFTNVKSLRGGMNKWHKKGYPTTRAKAADDLMYLVEDSKIEVKPTVIEKYTGEIHKTIDARNFNCPIPVLKSKKALEKLKIGQVLEVLTTDPGSKRDIPAWAEATGQELISLDEKIPEEYRFIVKRLK